MIICYVNKYNKYLFAGVPDPESGTDTSVSYNDVTYSDYSHCNETIVEDPPENIPLDSSNDGGWAKKKPSRKIGQWRKITTKQYKKFAKSTCRKLASHERNFETHWITGREH